MTIINKRLINYILIDKRLNEHFGQISIDFWSLEITEIKFEIRNQLEIKLISKSRTRFQQVSDPSPAGRSKNLAHAIYIHCMHIIPIIITLCSYELLPFTLTPQAIALLNMFNRFVIHFNALHPRLHHCVHRSHSKENSQESTANFNCNDSEMRYI